MTTIELPQLELPSKYVPIWEPKRYKVLYGGRSSAKSWTIARVLLTMALERKLRIMCAREIQNSLKESVHELLDQQIDKLGYRFVDVQDKRIPLYTVQKDEIIGYNGSTFFFTGLRHKIDSIKSVEGVDICWVEEAHTISKSSLDKLRPTIRKPGSELWFSFNPDLSDDEVYKYFVLNPPENSWVQYLTYKDNPWLTDEIKNEIKDVRSRSEDDYQHIYLGKLRQALEGAVYADELRLANEEGRITKVPYDKQYPVHCGFDLGYHDLTAIWMFQRVGFEIFFIDYYENQFKDVEHYVKVLKSKNYNYGQMILPHDAEAHHTSGVDWAHQFHELMGGEYPTVIPRESVAIGVNAVRMLFPKFYFDETKCAEGLSALRHYQYEKNERKSTDEHAHFSPAPLHDWASHASDAIRMIALSNRKPRNRPQLELVGKKPILSLRGTGRKQAWMGR